MSLQEFARGRDGSSSLEKDSGVFKKWSVSDNELLASKHSAVNEFSNTTKQRAQCGHIASQADRRSRSYFT